MRDQFQTNQSAVTDANDIARIRINRAKGLQCARIKKVTDAKRTAGTRLFVHDSRQDSLLIDSVNELEISQQRECVEAASDTGFVIRRAAPEHAPIFDLCCKRGA